MAGGGVMGWMFLYAATTRKWLIADRTKTHSNEKATWTSLAHCTRGNVLWIAWEITHKDGSPPIRFIECDLLQKQGRDGPWGYKDMEESMHPYYYTCPLKYLDMVPQPPGADAGAWRQSVRQYHAERRERMVSR
jgi:hypothetical protein